MVFAREDRQKKHDSSEPMDILEFQNVSPIRILDSVRL